MGMSWDREMRCVKVCQISFGSCHRSMQTVTNKTQAVYVLKNVCSHIQATVYSSNTICPSRAVETVVPVIQDAPGLPEAAGLSVCPPRWLWFTCRAQLPGRTPNPRPAATGQSRASLPRPPPPGGRLCGRKGEERTCFLSFWPV